MNSEGPSDQTLQSARTFELSVGQRPTLAIVSESSARIVGAAFPNKPLR
jgi:hypothetical protein